jgi:arginyl-tRNA synthetase
VIEVAEESDAQPMPPLILAKSDGAALYATTDLATILHQVRADKPAKIVYVVDQRQALHFEQVFRAARRAGMAPGVDADRMVSFEGRTGPYVQYACMRIGSILKRAKTLDCSCSELRCQTECRTAARRCCISAVDVCAENQHITPGQAPLN